MSLFVEVVRDPDGKIWLRLMFVNQFEDMRGPGEPDMDDWVVA